jgi:hypothetical protein
MRSNPIKANLTSARVTDRLDRRGSFAVESEIIALQRGIRKTLDDDTVASSNAAFSPHRAPAVLPMRASQVLRGILTKNPTVKKFTVKQIVDSIGEHRVGTSLIFFSIPAMLPVPGTSNLAGIPAGLIAGQMIAGKTTIKLPRSILRRSVSRRSLSVAIYAILPVLEMSERATKPRWQWACHPVAQQILGVLLFLLALAIALPIVGFNVPHAASIFAISLGLVERDGVAILIGVIAGLASLILLTGANLSGRALRSGAVGWMKNMFKKVGLKWAANLGLKWATSFLKKRGRQWTTLLLLEWAELLLDPEASTRHTTGKRPRKNTLQLEQPRSAARRSQKIARPPAGRSHLQTGERPSARRRALVVK